MKQHSKSEAQQQQHAAEQVSQQPLAREFAAAEELLRFDAAQTTVPPAIAQRLAKSSAEIPPPRQSWWKRLFE
jgi:hypothetical protein